MQRVYQNIKYKGIFLLSLILFFASATPGAAAENIPRQVRVGFYPLTGFQQQAADGSFSGFGHEFMQALAQYTNWKYEYIVCDSRQECLQKLKDGEVDLVANVAKSNEMEAVFDFAEQPINYASTLLAVAPDRVQIGYHDYAAFDGMTIGMARDNEQRNAGFLAFCEEKGIHVTERMYADHEMLYHALDSGEVDGVIGLGNQTFSDYRIVERIDVIPEFFAVQKGNQMLLDELNTGLENLGLYCPTLREELYYQYYNGASMREIILTQEEEDFLAENPVITVFYDPLWFPIEYYNPETGEAQGISMDILQRITEITGLRFAYANADTFGEAVQRFRKGEADVFSALTYNYDWGETNHAKLTQAFLEISYATIFRNDSSGKTRMALPEGYFITKFVEGKHLDEMEHLYFASPQDCIEAVYNGEADFTFCNAYETDYFLSMPKYRSLKFRSLQGMTQKISIAVSESADERLFSILSKALLCISEEDITVIVRRQTKLMPEGGFLDMLYTNPKQFMVITSAGLLLLSMLCVISFFFMTNRKRNAALEEALAAKGNFLSSVSHDMRTPMNAIIGLSDIKNSVMTLEEAQDSLRKIHFSGEYLLGLINDILDISKMDSGKVQLHPEVYGSDEFVQSISDLLMPKAAAKGVTLRIETPVNYHYYLLLDKMRLQQIFVNLLANAIKFTPPGGEVLLSISGLDVCDGRMQLQFIVRDNGIGMSEEFQKKMFEPFEQEGRRGDRDTEEGTGLGLAIVKNLITLMGGSIVCKSEKGKGTEFQVFLTAEICYVSADKEGETPAVSHSALEGKRVLLAEDHPLNVIVAEKMLRHLNMEVETAENGEKAVERFLAMPAGYYDVILMDIRMPVMDGITAAKEIRTSAHPQAQSIPIIAMTANSYTEDRKKTYDDAGMNEHVEKPVNPNVLYAVLYKYLH